MKNTLHNFVAMDWNFWRGREAELHSPLLDTQHNKFNVLPDPNPFPGFPIQN
jgi:hypothetical protein